MRFIKLILSLNDTNYWFHQTLTFGKGIANPTDLKATKKCLHAFLDSFVKEMEKDTRMGILYIMGRQESERGHFHVIFFCYPPQSVSPEHLAERLREVAWQRWKKHGGGPKRQYNRLTIQPKAGALDYLLKGHFRLAQTNREKGKPRCYGSWSIGDEDFIKNHSSPVQWRDVRQKFKELFPKQPRPPKAVQPERVFTMRDIEFTKAYLETKGVEDWQSFKMRQAGRIRRISDIDYLDFLNQKTRIAVKRRESSAPDTL